MKKIDLEKILIECGWVKFKQDSDTAFLCRISEKLVTVYFYSSNSQLDFFPILISNDFFDKFHHIIGACDTNYETKSTVVRQYVQGSYVCQTRVRLVKANYSPQDARDTIAKVLHDAASVDVIRGLAELRAATISGLGNLPLRHLVALALDGDLETLGHYRDRFAAGDRMDCVPYITIDYITRALELAEKRKADPNWMPDKPKIRV